MIELTNEQILGLNQSLSELQDSKIALNIKVSYKLARIKKNKELAYNLLHHSVKLQKNESGRKK